MLLLAKEVSMAKIRGFFVLALLFGALMLTGCFLFSNRPPEAAFTVGYGVNPEDPLVVELDASSSSDPDGDAIIAYSWVFGDDVTMIAPLEYTASVQTPVLRVRYPFEGTYSLSLVVRDEEGLSSTPVSKSITLPNESVSPMR
jgi:PKD repeat protein